jgi:hypothetical protein
MILWFNTIHTVENTNLYIVSAEKRIGRIVSISRFESYCKIQYFYDTYFYWLWMTWYDEIKPSTLCCKITFAFDLICELQCEIWWNHVGLCKYQRFKRGGESDLWGPLSEAHVVIKDVCLVGVRLCTHQNFTLIQSFCCCFFLFNFRLSYI